MRVNFLAVDPRNGSQISKSGELIGFVAVGPDVVGVVWHENHFSRVRLEQLRTENTAGQD